MNRFTVIGNLGRKPELYTMDNGNGKCNLNVATEKRVKRGDNWEKETAWVSVTAFGKDAEFASRYLDKGSKVLVEGTIENKKVNDEYKTFVTAKTVQSLGRPASQQDTGLSASNEAPTLDNVDIPF
jgi:single stranded DNA-binding protein